MFFFSYLIENYLENSFRIEASGQCFLFDLIFFAFHGFIHGAAEGEDYFEDMFFIELS